MGNRSKEAEEVGRRAFAAGRPAVPALDPELCKMLRPSPGSDAVLSILDGWIRGWHSANAEAPVSGA